MSKMPLLKTQYFPLAGGLNVESAQLAMPPGVVIGALNYEASAETGYERIGGFERFDGQPRPSDSVYRILESATGFTGLAVGDSVSGFTSLATGKVIALRGTNQIVVTRITGTWQYGENILKAGNVCGVLTTDGVDITGFDDNTFAALAAADYRANIQAVPGSGPIRGLSFLNSTLYAWRDNVGGTACAIYKSSASGWTLCSLGFELSFTAGSGTPPAEGATVTKGAVSGVVARVVQESGSWASSTAAGRLILSSVTGGPFSAGAFTAGITATCSGAETAITLAPGGRLDAAVYNFTGVAGGSRIYGADGVNRGFEFDGTTYVPIKTGMATDKPTHCAVHKHHLFFSFAGSIQHSAIADPYRWTAVLGAGEIAAGDVVTGFHVLPSDSDGALMVFTPQSTKVLYGSSSADWKFSNFADAVGAQRWSPQSLGRLLVYDTLGVATIEQSQSFGNFDRLPISARIQKLLQNRTVVASTVNRSLKRMRLFFSAGDALSITPTAEGVSFMPVNYGKTVSCTLECVIGAEHRTFFGASDGFVYEADRGRSFDGAEIFAFLKLAFNHAKSPMERKRFRRIDLESTTDSACSLRVHGEYSYGDPDVGLTSSTQITRSADGAAFDLTNFDESFFDVPTHSINKIRVDGVGINMSVSVVSQASTELPHTLQSVTTVYTPRRLDR